MFAERLEAIAALQWRRVDMSVNEKTQTLQIECNGGAVAKIKDCRGGIFHDRRAPAPKQ